MRRYQLRRELKMIVPSFLLIALVSHGLVEVATAERKKREEGKEWSHFGDTGPDHWVELGYPDCGGDLQSPIFIQANETDYVYIKPIRYTGYNVKKKNLRFENIGVTVKITLAEDDEDIPYIEGGTFDDRYMFEKIVFSFGTSNYNGSEHVYSNNWHPTKPIGRAMEMQMYHTYDGELPEGKPNWVVLSAPFVANYGEHKGFKPLLKVLPDIKYKGQFTKLEDLALETLFPGNLTKRIHGYYGLYFEYDGSLTYPPCTESVKWIIFKEPTGIHLSPEQADKFRKTLKRTPKGVKERWMARNVRPLQELNDRRPIDRDPTAWNG